MWSTADHEEWKFLEFCRGRKKSSELGNTVPQTFKVKVNNNGKNSYVTNGQYIVKR